MDDSLIKSSGSEVQPESSDVNGDTNASFLRMPAWNRPLNGGVEVGSLMGGAVSWPTLSESPLPRSSSDSSKPFPDGSASSSQAPVISPPPQRQTNTTNSHANSSSSNTTRPRSRNRGRGPSHNTFIRPSLPSPPPFPVYGMVPPMLDVIGRRPVQGRRNRDRRDVHLLPQFVPPPIGYMPFPLPPVAVPLMAPPFMVAPYVYLPTMSHEFFRDMPFVPPPPPPPMLFPPANRRTLANMIVNQIEYYFSDINLVKDNFLKSKMDDHGWVPVSVIASFPRIQRLTKDISFVLESLRYSTSVEVQGDNLRRRNEWNKWLLCSSRLKKDDPAPQTPAGNILTKPTLDDSLTNANGSTNLNDKGRALPEESIEQSRLVNGEDTSEEIYSVKMAAEEDQRE